ncbi:MAG TPA: hypothetical protein DGT23_29260 [Micromonosporaceae bacterium]|nr:hypothetical protein [Micromonosporaceae bacterium]
MTEHQGHLDRDTAERLLGGAAATPGAGADRLAQLLASASAAPRAHELSGEDAAAMAFREAAARPRPSRRGFWRRLLTFKAIAALIAVAISGLAFASNAGVLPRPFKVDPIPAPVQPPVRPNPPVHKSKPATPATQDSGHDCGHDDGDCAHKPKKTHTPKPSKSAKHSPRPQQ